jgi:hypothetical protein
MNLHYAVDRLYEVGWLPEYDQPLEHLDDGRRYPSVQSIKDEFARAGLSLSIKQNLMFKCSRATWAPDHEQIDPSHPADGTHGTVVGACEREAAVFAFAQLLETQRLGHLAVMVPLSPLAS